MTVAHSEEHVKTPDPVATDDVVLVVDLDGTLCRTDTLHEGLLGLISKAPLELFKIPGWLREGRAGFKARLADHAILEADKLPLNEAVVDLVRTARAAGRKTALVSAADHRQVAAIAHATELFDESHGSNEERNLKGAEKAAFLNDRFGAKKFDYIGDSKADLPVWAAARAGISIGAGAGLKAAANTANADMRHLETDTHRGRALIKALRPHQWSKNALLFLPMLAAHDFSAFLSVALGFVAFCLTASAVYVMNDLLDLADDRAHPRKNKRPFASGALSAAQGVVMAAGLLLGALMLGLATGNPIFLAVLGLYLTATFAYSFWLKRKLLIDVLMLAGLYTIRIIAGAAAAWVSLSPWMLGFSMFLFLALAAIKRQAELTDQMITGRESKGRAYEVDDLPILRGIALSAANATTLVLALYISSDNVQALYPRPELLWVIAPLMLYWLLRMVMKTHRGDMPDDPIVFAATDRVSLCLIIACLTVAISAAV